MIRGRLAALAILAVATVAAVVLVGGCSTTVSGTATWPGATLDRVALTQGDFPPGVRYQRMVEDPDTPDGAGGPPPMLSRPAGCSNALTEVIARSAERGPGSALKYSVSYDGARIVMTVLSWHLDLDRLAAEAARCEHFITFFDQGSPGIPITTTKLPSEDQALTYQQTMELSGSRSSIVMAFANVGSLAVFGIAFPTEDSSIPVKGTLPQTFLDVFGQQTHRMRSER
ncbi:hypothetical protein [Mycolicibacterium palauense]|uniref:hypothetical protein n=1 Tax=Mycolicibacterium palauense TaxID=2034511 RepID=UPI000BFF04DA|nr:hypothetical protein [Mycolicibacterium palauense]